MTRADTAISLTAHLILDQLNAEGVRYIFGTSSTSDSPIAITLLASRYHESDIIKFVGSLHESIAVFMATGYSQATSLPSVVNLACGQGILNAIPAIYAAKRAQVPMVILADQEDSHLLNDDPPLSVEHHILTSSLCKWMAEAKTAREVCKLLRRAFHEAFTPPKGPVILSLPINLSLSSAKAEILKPPITGPLGPADENFVSKIVQKLIAASNPCIIAGNEVSQFRARKDVVLLADVLGCPVFSEPMPTGVNFPNRHPHFGGVLPTNHAETNNRLKDHDLFLLLGVQNRLPNRGDGPSLVPDTGTVIQVNMDGHLAGRSIRSNFAIQADISETLSRVRAELQLQVDKTWLEGVNSRARSTIQGISARRQSVEESITYPDPKRPASLFWLLRILDGVRPQKSVVVTDIVVGESAPFEVLSLESGSSFFASTSGISGYAPGAALGVQWAGSDIPVICICGDESFLGLPQALWTAAHYDLNSKFVIAKTQGRDSLKVLPSAPTRKPPRWEFAEPGINISQLAAAFGIASSTVNTFSELETELTRLFEKRGPRLVEVVIE
ncbi:MAG: thiamine pyrophosphate-binding protein [Candidatus Melainabacteria bacterium]|nr:thiamine pyrophosphate-binding protein [Candidatus Melainabacteria bacterium]